MNMMLLVPFYAVVMGSLVTFIPISFSGIGTRDLAIISYLMSVSINYENALAFSMIVFVNFYLAYGLIGYLAWIKKPFYFNKKSLSA